MAQEKLTISMREAFSLGYTFIADTACKFYSYLHIKGFFYSPNDSLISITFEDPNVIAYKSFVKLPFPGMNPGNDLGFEVRCFRDTEEVTEDIFVTFRTEKFQIRCSFLELCAERIRRYPSLQLMQKFVEMAKGLGNARVLDIGGRARSKVDRSKDFVGCECTVLDILPGENVDVVGDAHKMSELFPPRTFDAVFSNSVFEHLMMPWTVAIHINKVLKLGGVGLIVTHQTLGMHDLPWDFWRFSDTAWDALFNQRTGFEIIERILDFHQYVVPFVWQYRSSAETSAGFGTSAVLFRKIGETSLSWEVSPADIVQTMYPDTDDGYIPPAR